MPLIIALVVVAMIALYLALSFMLVLRILFRIDPEWHKYPDLEKLWVKKAHQWIDGSRWLSLWYLPLFWVEHWFVREEEEE